MPLEWRPWYPGVGRWGDRLGGSHKGGSRNGLLQEMIREKGNLTSGGFSLPSARLALWRVKCSGVSPPVSSPLYFGLIDSSHATKNELLLLTLDLQVLYTWALIKSFILWPQAMEATIGCDRLVTGTCPCRLHPV